MAARRNRNRSRAYPENHPTHPSRRKYVAGVPARADSGRPVPEDHLTVNDVLNARGQYTEEFAVRVASPAVILVLERDCPARLEVAGVQTNGEKLALHEWIRRDELAGDVMAVYFAHGEDDPLSYEREDRHAERLAAALPLTTHRVGTGGSTGPFGPVNT
jgi:hypothetical protein